MKKCNYDSQANLWDREEPKLISDFVARPILISKIKKVGKGKDVLDAGCGEGYLSRKIRNYVNSLIGIDYSKGMIDVAKQKEKENPLDIKFYVGDVKNLSRIKNSSKDIYISSMVCHYLKPKELSKFYGEISRILKPKGKFYIITPSPKMIEMLSITSKKSLWLANKKKFDYIKSRGEYFPIELRSTKDEIVPVGIIYSTMEDHLNSLKSAGLKLTLIKEITVSKTLAKEEKLFDDLVGKSIYTFIEGRK